MNVGQRARMLLTDLEPTASDFRADVLAGLQARPRQIPSKYFYDARGSALFDRICLLPEYYPTRSEVAILTRYLREIADFGGPECLLIELGSGSSVKTRLLLDGLPRPAGYMPIDISRSHLLQSAESLAREYPELELLPVCADYTQPLQWPAPTRPARRRLLFYPGSTLGNFHPEEACTFLRMLAASCGEGDRLLIGVDHVKDPAVFLAAYNDTAGVTAAFNLNLLVRMNAELGADFALAQFTHQAIYAERLQRIEMHLVSRSAQLVRIGREALWFEAGEVIVTEYSYKYRPEQFLALAQAAGWSGGEPWTDPRGWFGVYPLERR